MTVSNPLYNLGPFLPPLSGFEPPPAPWLGKDGEAMVVLWNAQLEWARLTTISQEPQKPADEGYGGT